MITSTQRKWITNKVWEILEKIATLEILWATLETQVRWKNRFLMIKCYNQMIMIKVLFNNSVNKYMILTDLRHRNNKKRE